MISSHRCGTEQIQSRCVTEVCPKPHTHYTVHYFMKCFMIVLMCNPTMQCNILWVKGQRSEVRIRGIEEGRILGLWGRN